MSAEQMADGARTPCGCRPHGRSTPSIAASCDCSRRTAAPRYGRWPTASTCPGPTPTPGSAGFIDDGVIRGFTARVDHERAGQGASAYITLKIVQNSWRTVREELQALPGATHIALVSGDFDVLLLVHTQDNRSLRELVLTKIQAIPEVLSTRTLLVFEETDLTPGTDRPTELT